jgi:hypothetical protein
MTKTEQTIHDGLLKTLKIARENGIIITNVQIAQNLLQDCDSTEPMPYKILGVKIIS